MYIVHSYHNNLDPYWLASSGGRGAFGCLLSKCCLYVLGSGIWDWIKPTIINYNCNYYMAGSVSGSNEVHVNLVPRGWDPSGLHRVSGPLGHSEKPPQRRLNLIGCWKLVPFTTISGAINPEPGNPGSGFGSSRPLSFPDHWSRGTQGLGMRLGTCKPYVQIDYPSG